MQTPKGSLQSGACVLVHPTQRSRDLDPETKRCSSFIGASGPLYAESCTVMWVHTQVAN